MKNKSDKHDLVFDESVTPGTDPDKKEQTRWLSSLLSSYTKVISARRFCRTRNAFADLTVQTC